MRGVAFRDLHNSLWWEHDRENIEIGTGVEISMARGARSAYVEAIRRLVGTLGEVPEGYDIAVVLTRDGRVTEWLSNMTDAVTFSASGCIVVVLRDADGWSRAAAQRTLDANRREYRAERGHLGEDDV